MAKVPQHLHLQHHRHTGRILQHKHTSYRGLALVIILATAVMISLNILARATADTITVYARLPAPIPTEAAVITSPADNTVITKSRLLVSGTCPITDLGVVVGITDNGTLAGSVPCQDNGTFSITILLDTGRHTLVAKTYTVTGDNGPDSTPVTVFHVTEAGQAGASDTGSGEQASGSQLVVTIDVPFITFGPAKDAIWVGTITGGTLPYRVHIGWDDGASSDYTATKEGQQSFVHHYRSMRPHTITFRVTDATGRSVVKSYAAVTPYVAPVLFTAPSTPWGGSVPWGLYGAYLLLLVVFGGLWARAHPYVYAKVPIRRRVAAAHKHKPARR